MSKQIINIGSQANDRSGDPLRTAFDKINQNFTELYTTASLDIQIPAQSGNVGKYLTTNGSELSWATVSGGGGNGDRLVNGEFEVVLDSLGLIQLGGGNLIDTVTPNKFILETGGDTDLEIFTIGAETDTYTWQFSKDGILNLPQCGAVGAAVIQPNDTTFGIKLISNGNTWAFGTDGTLSAPYGKLGLATGEIFGIVADADTAATIQSDGGSHAWSFGIDGGLSFPDNTVQTTAYTGSGVVGLEGVITNEGDPGDESYRLVLDEQLIIRVYYASGGAANNGFSIGRDNEFGFRGNGVVAIGNDDVGYNSKPGGVYIGYQAGWLSDESHESGQGENAIAIGAKAAYVYAPDNSITLNATGENLNPTGSGLFIKPVREAVYNNNVLYYNPTSGEITYTSVFDIVVAGDTAPDSGIMWFNSEEARMYVRYDEQWVDASPTVLAPPDTNPTLESVTFDDATVQTTAWTGTYSYNDLTNKPTFVGGGNASTWLTAE